MNSLYKYACKFLEATKLPSHKEEPKQPCDLCGRDTFGDAYVRYPNEGMVIICLTCAVDFDKKHESHEEFMNRWVNPEAIEDAMKEDEKSRLN